MEEKNIIGLEAEPVKVADGTDKQLTGDDKGKHKEDSLEERKARLLREGEFYRVGVAHAKAAIKQGARPETLFHNAVDHAAFAVRSRVDNILRPTGINVATVMPYAVTVLNFLRKRRLVKPTLGVLGVVAAGAYYWKQHYGKRTY